MFSPLLERFIEDLLVEAKLTAMPEDVKKAYAFKVGEAIEKRLGLKALEVLKDTDAQELGQRMSSGHLTNSEAMFAFFREKIPDFDAFLAQVLLEFRNDFVQSAAQTRKNQTAS